MTNIVVTKDIVRRLSAAMATVNSSGLKNTARIEMIAQAFGWRADAFMHALKSRQSPSPAVPSGSTDDISLEQIGIGALVKWKRVLNSKSGLCVACGCTQSGRTTTLVASANHLRNMGRKVFHRDLITRENMNSGDVLLFGPIRDEQDAREALRHAQSGFLVLAITAYRTTDEFAQNFMSNCDRDVTQLVGGISQQLVWGRCMDCDGSGCDKCGNNKRRRVLVSHVDHFEGSQRSLNQDRDAVRASVIFADDVKRLLDTGRLVPSDIERYFGPKMLPVIFSN